MVNGLLLAAAWAAAARIPICMLSLERTDDDMLVGCLLARLVPRRSCCFSSLTKMTESPASNLFPLTKRLQPVVSRCLFG